MYFFFNTLYYLLKPGVVREHLALHSNCFSIAILHSNCFSIAINFLTILDDFWHFEKSCLKKVSLGLKNRF